MAQNSAIERLNNQRNTVDAQRKGFDLSQIIESRKRMNKPKKLDVITFEQIMRIVNDPKVFSEKGGGCEIEDGEPKFYIAGWAFQAYNINMREWRQALQINKRVLKRSGIMKWHTHPYTKGWWPSVEDLRIARDELDIIFTMYGIWIYNKKREINYEKLYQVYNGLHNDLHERTRVLKAAKTAEQFTEPFNRILDTIKSQYIPKFGECGINVHFYPGTLSTMKQDVITHLKSDR